MATLTSLRSEGFQYWRHWRRMALKVKKRQSQQTADDRMTTVEMMPMLAKRTCGSTPEISLAAPLPAAHDPVDVEIIIEALRQHREILQRRKSERSYTCLY